MKETKEKKHFTLMSHKELFLKRALWETYGKKCVYCGLELMAKEVEIDHIWPQTPDKEFDSEELVEYKKELEERGFEEDTLENFLPSCKNCNNAKKRNFSLGVSNLRFYYSLTFRKREEVQRKITKYKTERGEDFIGRIKKEQEEHVEQYELNVEKRINYSFNLMSYVWGRGHACIRAFIPLDYTETLACMICTEELNKSKLSYTLADNEMRKKLFAGIGLSVEERPWCTHFFPEEGKKDYCINFPNIRFEATIDEVSELAEIIDDLYDEYMLQDGRIRGILGVNNFESEQINKVKIIEIPIILWNEIVWFAQHHACNRVNSEWNIFNLNCNKNVIQLMLNDEDKHRSDDSYFAVGVITQYVAEREENNRISVYWKPGFGAIEISKLDCFDNVFKWKADYAHDWLLYKLIPYILFSKLPWYKKIKYSGYLDNSFIKEFVVEDDDIISLKCDI